MWRLVWIFLAAFFFLIAAESEKEEKAFTENILSHTSMN